MWEESSNHTVDIGSPDADSDQREHIQAPVDNGSPTPLKEGPSAPEHNWSGQHKLQPIKELGRNNALDRCPGIMSDMARRKIGAVSTRQIQKRRVMLTSSGLASSSKLTVLSSRAIPHMGQKPGSGRTISGCMGQTYSVLIEGAEGAAGSSAIPHLGHASWFRFANLGIHRTDIGSRFGFIHLRSVRTGVFVRMTVAVRRMIARRRLQELLRIFFELRQTVLAAKIISLPVVNVLRRRRCPAPLSCRRLDQSLCNFPTLSCYVTVIG